MAISSGSYVWFPAMSDMIIAAYGRCQIRRAMLTVDHLQDAAMAANLMQVDWANDQVNLWTVELASMPLVPGQATYPVDPTTIMIMAAYITTEELDLTADDSNVDADDYQPTVDAVSAPGKKDRIITSVDRDTYASYPDKRKPGQPTIYWFNQQVGPSVVLWEVPDGARRYMLHYYRARQLQDAVMGGGALPDVPQHFLEAYVAGLAHKVSLTWAPPRSAELGALAAQAFKRAAERDVENAPLRIVPAMSAYTNAVY